MGVAWVGSGVGGGLGLGGGSETQETGGLMLTGFFLYFEVFTKFQNDSIKTKCVGANYVSVSGWRCEDGPPGLPMDARVLPLPPYHSVPTARAQGNGPRQAATPNTTDMLWVTLN